MLHLKRTKICTLENKINYKKMDVKKKNKKSIILLMMMNIIIISPNCPPIYKSPCRVLIGLSMHKTMVLEVAWFCAHGFVWLFPMECEYQKEIYKI